MDYYLVVTVEENGKKREVHRKIWLEYSEEENERCLINVAYEIASKMLGIIKFKISEPEDFTFHFEEFDSKNHYEHLDNSALKEVAAEMSRQDKKWGEQNHGVIEWIAILAEEFGEVSKEAVDFHFANGDVNPKLNAGETLQRQRIDNYRKECIQVAAVAVQMVESLDRQLGKE